MRVPKSLLLPVLAWGWLLVGDAAAQNGSGRLVGKPAPQFHVQGIFSETYSLETYKGHILVMQFGTSW